MTSAQPESCKTRQKKLNTIIAKKYRLENLVYADRNAEMLIEEERAKGGKVKKRGYDVIPRPKIRALIGELIEMYKELGIKDNSTKYIEELRKKYF